MKMRIYTGILITVITGALLATGFMLTSENILHYGSAGTSPNAANITGADVQATESEKETAEARRQEADIIEPIAGFTQRITKKYYGLFITPQTSPVQPDKFTGYHNGVDIEYTDTGQDVPVYAIADGSVEFSGWVKGYGGVVVLRHTIQGADYFVLYGHLDPESLISKDAQRAKKGQVIGVLGDGASYETDGARKHLHFSVRPAQHGFDIRGYVGDEATLEQWVDPLSIY